MTLVRADLAAADRHVTEGVAREAEQLEDMTLVRADLAAADRHVTEGVAREAEQLEDMTLVRADLAVADRHVTEGVAREAEQLEDMTRVRRLLVSRTRELRSTTGAIEVAESEIVRRLSMAVEWRDDDTGQHIDRVSRFSALLAQRAKLDPELWEPIVWPARCTMQGRSPSPMRSCSSPASSLPRSAR
jgi:HD-GYP domain-containing protein (c-di-GMP phosphodiesterase class II)